MANEYPHELSPDAMHEELAAAEKSKADAEATRAFVLEHVHKLRGATIAMEISSLQNLPGHSCLIVNDHYLYSYREAEELIKSLETINVGSHP